MSDLATVDRLALALPDVEPKKHFRLDGYAAGGKGFATIEKGGERLMLALPGAEAQAIAEANSDAVAVVSRNGKPIGIAVLLASVEEALLKQWIALAREHAMKKR